MISPCRRHQPESLSVESSPLSLSGRRIRVSLALLDDSASLSLSLSLVDESASPSLSSTIPPPSRSPRRLRVSLTLHDGSPRSSFT
ncbi:hypothetical protein DY000_02047595 [Brassica cretica]|uniref:REJ domain-containing protein n=1 Tax=Brassica cretica TaxID=69181 RepID=A0ABQ7EQJ0_BRACR|nr:hypothetical protein DY000_02047595 [Brassica cretica]